MDKITTWQEIAQSKNVQLNSLRITLARKGVQLTSAQMRGIAQPEHVAILGANPRKAKKTPATPPERPDKPAPQPQTTEPILRAGKTESKISKRMVLLYLINTGELCMVLIGAFVLFGLPGIIPGGLVALFYIHSILEMHNGKSEFAKEVALFVCAIFSMSFVWLHGQTFWYLFRAAKELQYGVSVASAWIVALIALSALWQTKNTNSE